MQKGLRFVLRFFNVYVPVLHFVLPFFRNVSEKVAGVAYRNTFRITIYYYLSFSKKINQKVRHIVLPFTYAGNFVLQIVNQVSLFGVTNRKTFCNKTNLRQAS